MRAVLTGQEARQQSGKGIDGLALLLSVERYQDRGQQAQWHIAPVATRVGPVGGHDLLLVRRTTEAEPMLLVRSVLGGNRNVAPVGGEVRTVLLFAAKARTRRASRNLDAMPFVYSLLGLLAGSVITYVIEVRRSARQRREVLFSEALSAVLVDRANASFPTHFRTSALSPDEQATVDRELAVEAYRRRALGIVERRAALARAVPYAPEVEPYVDLIELSEEDVRAVKAHLVVRLGAKRGTRRQLRGEPVDRSG